MKKILVIVIMLIDAVLSAECQQYTSIRSQMIPDNLLTCSLQDANAMFCNPSGISKLEHSCVLLRYSHDYALSELWNGDVAYLCKTKYGILPLCFSCKGPKCCINIKLKSGYGMKLTDKFSAGIYLCSDYYIITNYKNIFTYGFSCGIQYNCNEKLNIGLMCDIPALIHQYSQSNVNNVILETSFSYIIFDKGKLNCGFRKSIFLPVEIISSFECCFSKHVNVIAGYHSGTDEFICGVTIYYDKMKFMLSATCNLDLGVTPEIQIMR